VERVKEATTKVGMPVKIYVICVGRSTCCTVLYRQKVLVVRAKSQMSCM